MNLIDKLNLMAARERGYLKLALPEADISLDLAGTAEAIETVREMQEALQEILRVHANDNNRPEAFYIAAKAFSRTEGNAG